LKKLRYLIMCVALTFENLWTSEPLLLQIKRSHFDVALSWWRIQDLFVHISGLLVCIARSRCCNIVMYTSWLALWPCGRNWKWTTPLASKNTFSMTLLWAVQTRRPEMRKNMSWILHHDKAPAHTALSIWQYLAKNNIPPIALLYNNHLSTRSGSLRLFVSKTKGNH